MKTILQKRIEEAAKQHAERRFNTRLLYDMYGRQSKSDFLNGAIFALKNQWISVEEALPDDDENVLLIFDDGHIIVAYHSGNYWWWCDGFVCGTKINGQPMYSSSQKVNNKPTHWMFIPSLEGGEK